MPKFAIHVCLSINRIITNSPRRHRHWALLVSAKSPHRGGTGTRHHVEHASNRYFYAEDEITYIPAAETILVRIAVAKVVDKARLRRILREVLLQQDEVSWNCLSWVREGFLRLVEDDCVKVYVEARDWRETEKKTCQYATKKRDERRETGDLIPTWNWWENRETQI
jgi:hypothetical protein